MEDLSHLTRAVTSWDGTSPEIDGCEMRHQRDAYRKLGVAQKGSSVWAIQKLI
jgi:hypothetical protein